MSLFRPFLHLVVSPNARCSIQTNAKYGNFQNCYKSLGYKINFRSDITRSFRTRNEKIKSSITKKDIAPENDGMASNGFGNQPLTMSLLWKPLLFTGTFSAGTFAVCAIWQYENMRKQTISFIKSPSLWNPNGEFWNSTKRFSWRERLNERWNRRDAEKLFYLICLANIIVHVAWKIKKLDSTMLKYFSSNPSSRALCWPLVLSTFSHCSTIHLAMNMCALHSFTAITVNSLGKEQFTFLYIAAGTVSSFVSLFFRVLRKQRSLSLGASGAILAVVGYITAKYPDLELSIIGLPTFTFSAETAVYTLVAFDLLGLLCGWRFLDHAGHLGGICAGMFWYYWGNTHIWQKREHFLHWWHELREYIK